MPTDFEFRKLLIDVANRMSDDSKKQFLFLLGDDIPERKKDEPLVEIFQILINAGRISDTDCSYLVQILQAIKLIDLAFLVARFENRNSPPTSPPTRIENHQSVETNSTSVVPTREEFWSSFNESDKMATYSTTKLLHDNDGSSKQIDSLSVIAEPELPAITICLEHTDFKTFRHEIWSSQFLEKINITIPPYGYQRELVQNAIGAKNTIICLRTGGGKTFVAALLMKYYLLEKTSSSASAKKFLAFFIVPRRAMLKQQVEKLKQFGNLRVVSYEDSNEAIQYINKYDVIVCTPQHLLDCLKTKTILMSSIDLLCFDECHDSVARHQYIGIMQYLMCTTISYIPPVSSSPIVIGLTAAIGFHGTPAVELLPNLINLCATFNCSTITSVWRSEHEEELERSAPHIFEDEIICVDKNKAFDMLRLTIERELHDFILQLFLNKDTNPSQIFPEKDFDMNGYEQNLELLKQSEQKNKNFSFVLLINSILPIYRNIKALNDLTPELVLSDLKDYLEMTYKRREHPIDIDTLIYEKCQNLLKKKLTELEESQQNLTNPKLDKLVELLKKHAEKPNSRALILVDRTFYANKICEFLQNHSELKNIIKPCSMVSQNSIGSKKCNKKDDTILKDFQTGVYNVLISTDVVEAGLDIPQCSLVLRYDFVPDSIGTVQTRARARATDCSYCLITTKDSANYKKENENRQNEHDLKDALNSWRRCSHDDFKRQVTESREFLIAEWNESLNKILTSKNNILKNTELIGEVLCRACSYVLGALETLRQHGPSFFVDDHDFYNRIEEKNFPEPEEFGRTLVTGKMLCGNKKCRAELGRITILKDQPKPKLIYPLKCTSIQIRQNGKENIIQKKKWSLMPFAIPHLEDSRTNSCDDIFFDAQETVSCD